MLTAFLLAIFFKSAFSVRKNIKSISVFSKDSFLQKHKEFILYLRPFDSDKYNEKLEKPIVPLHEETSLAKHARTAASARYSFTDFSEDKLVKLLSNSKSYPICAIGMTKEAEQPVGAIRIYVEDYSWHTEIIDLMLTAKAIIVLVSDKENCIWEIRRTAPLLDKTIFIIEDTNYYETVRKTIGEIIHLPILTNSKTEDMRAQPHFVIKNKNNAFSFKEYDHTIEGYKTITDFIFSVILPFEIKGIFSMLNEAYSRNQQNEWRTRRRMKKMNSYLCSHCPIKVNEQLTLTSCHLKGGNKLCLKFTLSGRHADLMHFKRYSYPLKFNLIERFMTETEDDFKAMALRSGLAFHLTFMSQSQNDLLKVSIKKSSIEKRIDENQDSIRMSSDWLSQILLPDNEPEDAAQ